MFKGYSLFIRKKATRCLQPAKMALFALLLIFPVADGAEIDSITPRKLELKNAVDHLNSIFNQRLADGVEKTNEKGDGQSCNEETLYTELRKSIFQSFTASWGLKGYSLDKQIRDLLREYSYSLSLNDSIYRDLDYLQAFSLNLKELSDLVNINGHLVGLDKIGHFFAEGWQYFELTREEGYDLARVTDWGKEQERGKFGYSTTGIYSFADLTANFNGWIFWNSILLKETGLMKSVNADYPTSAYVSCNLQIWESIKQGKFVRAWHYNFGLDFSDYVDGAWDEGNNCNSYQDPVIEKKVESRIKRVAPGYACPLNKQACSEAKARYGRYARYLLHPACLTSR